MLVLHEMKYLAPDAPKEVSKETLVVMRRGLVEEIDRLDRRYCRLSELTDFFDDVGSPTLEEFRKSLLVFFPNRSQEEAEAYFVYNYNQYIKEAVAPWVKNVDESLFNILHAKSDDYADLTEDVGLMHGAAMDELQLLVKVEELLEKKATRKEFFDEVQKFGIDLRAYVDV